MAEEHTAARLFEGDPLPAWTCDPHTLRVLEATPDAAGLFTDGTGGVVGRSVADLVAPEESAGLRTWLRTAGAASRTRVFRSARPGTVTHVEFAVRRAVREGAEVILCHGRDASAQRASEARARGWEESYRALALGANDGMWEIDLLARRVRVSPRLAGMLGLGEADLSGDPEGWLGLIHPEDRPDVDLEMDLHLKGLTPHVERECRMRARDGTYRWVLLRGEAVRDDDGVAVRLAGSQTDIGDRKRFEEQFVEHALYDGLTGLANRVLFADRLAFMLARLRRDPRLEFAVFYLDIDRFTAINQGLGHACGDAVLREAGRRIADAAGSGATVARFGGDDFALLIEDPEAVSEPIARARGLLARLDEPFRVGGEEVFAQASIGVVVCSDPDEGLEDVIRDAETAMRRAREDGPGTAVLFVPGMQVDAAQRRRVETELRRGVSRGEIVPHFQPIVSLRDMRIVGAEALARWAHPERGLLSPGDFIPVAEQTGLITEIGEIVLSTACARCRSWLDDRVSDVSVSVNLSARQFVPDRLPSVVAGTLADSGLEPRHLELEVTESAVMQDPDTSLAMIREVSACGVRFSMDDFGTGYSSLSYLKRYPFDSIKIDRSFVTDVASDADSAMMVAAIVGLSHGFKMSVVAEGVETLEQLDFLRALRCDRVQGFLTGRPMPGDDFVDLLHAGLPRYLARA